MRQVVRRVSGGRGAVRTLVVGVTLLALFVSIMGFLATSRPAQAADFSGASEFKLTASDGAQTDQLGWAVAIDGDTAVVGANRGLAAYVFVRSGTTWTQQAKLRGMYCGTGDEFGCSVAISGDTVVVGALGYGGLGGLGSYPGMGAACVFVRSGTAWTEQAMLVASDGAAHDNFGSSVSISGDTVVIGAKHDTVGANGWQGSAYVFVRSGTTWSQQAQLTASDGAANDSFGISAAISGDTAVVGAYGHTVGANTGQGSAYVFVRSGTSWSQQAQLTASDGAAVDHFGYSVAISGDRALVGAPYKTVGSNTGQGSAYVYDAAASVPAPSPSPSPAPSPATSPGGAQVAATFTLESISVTISEGYPTAVNYGVTAPNAEAVPVGYTPGTYHYLRVQNNGSVAEDLLIKGADATCGQGTLTLAATPGVDQYSHLYGVGQTPTTYSALSTSASTLGTNVAVGGTVDFNLKIQTPTSSTVWGQYSTTVAVLAVAH